MTSYRFWASEHKYDEQLLSIRKGGVLQRAKKRKKDKKPKGDISSHGEEQGGQPAKEEDAVVAAFDENEHEESEDAVNEGQEVIDMIDMTADMPLEFVDESQVNQGSPEEMRHEVEVPVDGKNQSPDLPPVAEARISPQGSDDRPAGSELQQPSEWNSQMLVIVDPFILTKVCQTPFISSCPEYLLMAIQNVCANIGKANIQRFQAECRRSAQLLDWGVDLESLMGDGEPLPDPRPRRGRGGRGRRRGGAGRGIDSTPARGERVRASQSEVGDGGRGQRGDLASRVHGFLTGLGGNSMSSHNRRRQHHDL